MKQSRTIDYEEYLISTLHDKKEAAGYLNAALEDGDTDVFLLALRHVIAAQGGITKLAQKIHCSRSSLYKTLSERGNPELKSITKILKALNLQLAIF